MPFKALDRQNQEIEAKIDAGERLTIRQGESIVADWPMQVIPDQVPSVIMAEKPKATVRGVMLLAYEASDDYGIANITARFRRPGDSSQLDVALPLPELNPRTVAAANYHDLTAHPWAGLEVTLILAAVDDLGQTGTSAEMKLLLPERRFSHPVARALIEQRKRLTVDPGSRDKIAQALGAISETPESFDDDLSASFAKLEGAAARFALIFHLVRWASSDRSLRDSEAVDGESVRAGAQVARWFAHETERIYAGLRETEAEAEQRRLVEFISVRGGSISSRELMRARPGTFGDSEKARAALDQMVQVGLGRWDTPSPSSRGGRPTTVFRLSDVGGGDRNGHGS